MKQAIYIILFGLLISLHIGINGLFVESQGSCKINCVTHYLSLENSSVGERPAPRGGTTRPDERKITII